MVIYVFFELEMLRVQHPIVRFDTYTLGFYSYWAYMSGFFFRLRCLEREAPGESVAFSLVPAVLYFLINLLLLYNFPLAVRDVIKYFMGDRDGNKKMSDLVRATIVVDATKPWHAYHMMNYIGSTPHFQLVRIKNKLKSLQHINANYIYKEKFVCEIQIRLGEVPLYYYANHFLYELQRG